MAYRPPLSGLMRLLILALPLTAGGWYYAGGKAAILPDESFMLEQMWSEPEQKFVQERAFEFDYRGAIYEVEPVANYRLWGLVVSHNDISEFSDIYHDENSVDIKDLCVVWGRNLEDNLHKRVVFFSEPWTCNWRPPDRETALLFDKAAIANNHLLSGRELVREDIQNVHIGDQIVMEGQLVNYCPLGRPNYRRETSTIREDTGNGACEVVFVDSLKILKRGNESWYRGRDFSKSAFYWILILLPCVFLLSVYLEQRQRREPL